jgi:hypothetical protein
MPYTILNADKFMALSNARFYRVKTLKALVRSLSTTDFSVVESRREAHRALNDFINEGLEGDSLFSETTRFVAATMADIFVCDADAVTQTLFVSLAAALSYRQTNKAKDTSAGTGTDKKEANVEIAFDQGLQDSTKRFEELVKRLSTLANDPIVVWRRGSFEERVAPWSDGTSKS